MLVKILGGIDFIFGLILIFGVNVTLPITLFTICGVCLLIKASVGLFKDFASWIDGISGIIFLLLIIFQVPWVIGLILGLLLIQKGFFSFL